MLLRKLSKGHFMLQHMMEVSLRILVNGVRLVLVIMGLGVSSVNLLSFVRIVQIYCIAGVSLSCIMCRNGKK